MPRNSSNAELESEELECTMRIRAAIEEEHEPLLRSIAVLVAKTGRESPLARSDGNCLGDPPRSGAGSSQTRGTIRPDPFGHGLGPRHRREAAFDPPTRGSPSLALYSRGRPRRRGLGGRARGSTAPDPPTRRSPDGSIWSRRSLASLPEERRAIEFRYYQGLDGEELAAALGVSTPGAARVRVCRALQSLRTHFAPAEEEVFP